MGCDYKLQFKNYQDGKLQASQYDILKDAPDNLNIDQVVDIISKLPKGERTKLAALFRVARVQPLTVKDVEKHDFISNTSLTQLQDKYPDLKEMFPDVDINEEHTLVTCNQMQLNGSNYYGRTISPSGSDIFFINGFYGAQHLFNYLDVKNKILKAIDGNLLREDLKEFQGDLDYIMDKYNISGQKLLLDYLDNKSKYKTFKTASGKVIIPSKILNKILSKVQNKYDSTQDKSELELALREVSDSKYSDRFGFKITSGNLYSVLSDFIDGMPSKEEFNKMSQEELQSFLHNIFIQDARLNRVQVSNIIGGETKEVIKDSTDKTITQTVIKKKWKELQNQLNDLGKLEEVIQNSPEQAIGFLKQALIDYHDLDISIQDGKVKAQYKTQSETQQKQSTKYIILKSPYSSLGEVYSFGYDSKYLFSPVKAEEGVDTDGMYNGCYVYKYYNPSTKVTHYAISRSIISPNSYAQTFASLEQAKAKIDNWNQTQTLRESGLYSIKMNPVVPRRAKLEYKNANVGQIITTLDLQLPKIAMNKLPKVFQQLFDSTVPEFQKVFGDVEDIETINTPEKAAAYLILFTKGLQTSENKNIDIKELIKNGKELGKQTVDKINQASTESYLIEDTVGGFVTLKHLVNNGNKIDITGKFNDEPATLPLTTTMNSAVDFFNQKFGVSIKTMSQSELNDFASQNNINVKNARAFVYDGDIYINSSNANISDLFHEMSHIFLGVLKTKYPESYQAVIQKYQQSKNFSNNLKYIDSIYTNFAMQDKIEECVADMIADKMYQKNSLLEEFKGADFLEDFSFIFDNFPKNVANPIKESGLTFDTFMSTAIKENSEGIKRNMKASNIIRQYIEEGKIKEFGC